MALRLGEVWEYRELLWFLALRDIKVRYKQTVLGAGWAVLQPVATAVIFTVVFGRLARIPSDGVPYAVFALTGLVPWTFFATAVGTTALSLVGNTNLISKVYFPRLCVPIATVLAGFVDLLVAIGRALRGDGALRRRRRAGGSLLVVPFAVLAFAAGARRRPLALGGSRRATGTCATSCRSSCSSGCSPRRWPTRAACCPSGWHVLYALNPMVGVVEGFRWALLGSEVAIAASSLASTAVAALVLLSAGLLLPAHGAPLRRCALTLP